MNTETTSSSSDRALLGSDVAAIKRRLSIGTPSQPLLGLPLKRIIPMDVHSVADYSSAALSLTSALVCDSPACRAVGFAMAGGYLGVSLCTDYKLSLAKLIPIEVHETIDYI